MGWASAGPIFNCVADAMIREKVSAAKTTAVLADLIEELQDGDWDTLDESIERYVEEPAVTAAFRKAAPDWMESDEGDEGLSEEDIHSPSDKAYEGSAGGDR